MAIGFTTHAGIGTTNIGVRQQMITRQIENGDIATTIALLLPMREDYH